MTRPTLMIVEPEPTALSGAIGALARDRDTRARMGAAGRARAADLFSLDSMVSKTREVYRDAVGR